MPFPHARLLFVAAAALLVAAPPAHAARTVEIKADRPGVTVAISALGGDGNPIATCSVPCTLDVPDGRYRIDVDSDAPVRHRALEVDRDVRVDVRAGSSSAGVGRVLGITGVVVTGVGVIAALSIGLTCISGACDDPGKSHEVRRDQYVALGVAGVSAAIAVTGWVLYFTNRTSFTIAGRPAVFGVTPLPGGLTAGLVGAF
jgi:hypothetical protein